MKEVCTQERTETRRDRYCWPLLGDGTVFLKRRRVVPLPDAFLGGVQEDAHTGRYLEVIPGRHDIGGKCLGCGIKHGENGGPGDTGSQAGSGGVIFTRPADEVPVQRNGNGDIGDG